MNSIRALPISLRPALSLISPASTLVSVRTIRTRAGAVADDGDGSNVSTVDRIRLRRIESMPFQTYQMALSYIKADRAEKLAAVQEEKKRIAGVIKKGGKNDRRLHSMYQHLDYLTIQADINNPRVKYNFDCGRGMFPIHYSYRRVMFWAISGYSAVVCKNDVHRKLTKERLCANVSGYEQANIPLSP